MMYFIGHGVFFNKNIISQIYWSENVLAEDLLLGYQLQSKGIIPLIIPYMDHTTVPRSFLSFIKQGGRWYSGEIQAITKMFGKYNLLTYSTRIIEILYWPLQPVLVLYVIIVSLDSAHYLLLGSVLIYTIINSIIIHMPAAHSMKVKIPIPEMIIRFFAEALPPAYGIIRIITNKIGLNNYIFEKTDR